MTSRKLHYILIGLIGLLVAGLIGGTYLANALLTGRSKQLLEARTQSQSLDQQQQQLARTKADIEKYKSLATIARGVVPQDKDQAAAVREIVRLAAANSVKLGAISFPSSTLGVGASAAGGKATLSQLKAVAGLSGVYTMPITVASDTNTTVPYARFISFLAGLEKNRRTALVSGITIQPSPQQPGTVGFTLTIDEYIKP